MAAAPIFPTASELLELVDHPNETLACEYKSWLDLSSSVPRADLARHSAALANHGGGCLVFGFNDDLTVAGPNPYTTAIDRDLVSGIIKRYLEPSFQCEVRTVRSIVGNDHPVILVPPHGASPICAKASGPLDAGGKPQGITMGVYYTRKTGPESAPILTAAEWSPIIRRCALHERSAILGALDLALRGAPAPSPTLDESVATWHNATHAVFLREVAQRRAPEALAKWHWQCSYAIERGNEEELDPATLLEVLRQVNAEVHDLVRSGWSMFYPFTRPEIEPTFVTDPASGLGERDFLELSMLRDPQRSYIASDVWRFAPNSLATLIRPYWEDDMDPGRVGRDRGTWLSPRLLAQTLAEVIRHARGVSERFALPLSVSFRCEWHGLSGRIRWDPWGLWRSGKAAQEDRRLVVGSWPVAELRNAWPEIVCTLAAPVMRVFGTDWRMTPDWVRGIAPTWLR